MGRARTPSLIILLLFVSFVLFPQDPYLSVELTEDPSILGFAMLKQADTAPSFPEEWENIQKEAVEKLLEEARWIFSGMIYGFRFRYVPGSSSLEVEDLFELEPLSLIPRGDPALRVEQVGGDFGNITIQFSYWPEELQKKRISRYRNSGFTAAGGAGSMGIMEPDARFGAMESAVKQALREDLRLRFYNRPREVSGFLVISHSPLMYIQSGSYNSSVRILYRIDELKSYPSG